MDSLLTNLVLICLYFNVDMAKVGLVIYSIKGLFLFEFINKYINEQGLAKVAMFYNPYLTEEGKEYVESLSGSEMIDILFAPIVYSYDLMHFDNTFYILSSLYRENKLRVEDITFILTYDYKYKQVYEEYLPEFVKCIERINNDS